MTIRSFVLRQGRITSGQERALAEHWPRYGLEVDENLRVDAASLFGDARELILEIGFGNGESFVQMAETAPQQGFVGKLVADLPLDAGQGGGFARVGFHKAA